MRALWAKRRMRRLRPTTAARTGFSGKLCRVCATPTRASVPGYRTRLVDASHDVLRACSLSVVCGRRYRPIVRADFAGVCACARQHSVVNEIHSPTPLQPLMRLCAIHARRPASNGQVSSTQGRQGRRQAQGRQEGKLAAVHRHYKRVVQWAVAASDGINSCYAQVGFLHGAASRAAAGRGYFSMVTHECD